MASQFRGSLAQALAKYLFFFSCSFMGQTHWHIPRGRFWLSYRCPDSPRGWQMPATFLVSIMVTWSYACFLGTGLQGTTVKKSDKVKKGHTALCLSSLLSLRPMKERNPTPSPCSEVSHKAILFHFIYMTNVIAWRFTSTVLCTSHGKDMKTM